MIKRIDLSGRLDIIEVLRFCAATAVVFRHIPVIAKGDIGVDIFFVISGFVMMLSTSQSSDQFFLKRFIRVVPTYWFFTLGVFGVALFAPSLLNNTTADFVHLLKSLFFIPFDKNGSGHWPVLFLGWTLNYEMYFYFLFALSLAVSNENRGVVVVVAITAILSLSQLYDGNFVLNVYGNLVVMEFALGVLVFMLLTERSPARILFVVGLVCAACFLNSASLGHRFYRYGLPAFIGVFACVSLFASVQMPKILVTLGGASYSLYLTHIYVIQIFDKITGWFSAGPTLQILATVVSILLVNTLAVLFYKFLEIPVGKLLRRKLIRRPKRVKMVPNCLAGTADPNP